MPKPLKIQLAKPPKMVLPKSKQGVSPFQWYGGKQSMVAFIWNHAPPHRTFVELFGGGGAVMFYKVPGWNDILNDIGNVTLFYAVLRDYGDELYEKLWYTPYSREELYRCRTSWQDFSNAWLKLDYDDRKFYHMAHADEAIEWARCWFVTVVMGYAHEESASTSFKPSKTQDLAYTWTNRVEDLPRFTKRLRGITLECADFERIIDIYDSETTLFYADPPYTPGTRVTQGNYTFEMPLERHKVLLNRLNNIQGQAMVSMYSDPLYEKELSGWRRDSITRQSSTQNSRSMADGRDMRTEVLWIKEKFYGLWTPFPMDETSSPDVPRKEDELEEQSETSILVRREEVIQE